MIVIFFHSVLKCEIITLYTPNRCHNQFLYGKKGAGLNTETIRLFLSPLPLLFMHTDKLYFYKCHENRLYGLNLICSSSVIKKLAL